MKIFVKFFFFTAQYTIVFAFHMKTKTLCQPDRLKGCSICCGLFNLKDISKQNLENFLLGRYSMELLSNVRDITSHVCTYQGFIGKNKPGCTLHPLVTGCDGRHASLYGSKICDEYLCPAHFILNEEQKEILISAVSDWYLYSTAIVDPEGFQCILKMIHDIQSSNQMAGMQTLLNEALSFHSITLSKNINNLFYYSKAEYNEHKKEFSLAYNAKEQSLMREHLIFRFCSSI